MRNRILTVICFLTGLSLCSYPLISNPAERRLQREVVATYQKNVEETADLEQITAQAREYNCMRDEADYEQQLNISGNGIMGSIEIPKINVNLPIRHGTSEEVISNGVGHLRESSLPVGGENTRCILTSHRGLPSSKLFTRLDELEKGDLFFINVCGKTLAYQIYEIQVIEPDDTEALYIIPEKDIVSLVTCTPYGLNTHRLVVNGERTSYEKKLYNSIKPEMFSLRELLFSTLPFIFCGIMVGTYIRRKRCKDNNE